MGKAKGTTFISAIKALRAQKDRARTLLPRHLHGYLDERILVSSWYPEEDLAEILRALAKILPDPGMDVWEFMGHFVARTDLGGVHAHLIRQGDPATTLRRASFTWGMYHDTGTKQVIESGDDYVVTEFSGFEHPSRENCKTIMGWNRELATMAGGKDVKVTHTQCELDKAPSCRFRVTWTK